MPPQQLILRVQRLWFLVLWDDMSSLAHVNNGGLWRGNRRIIVGYEDLVGAVFRRLWWLHRILRLKGFVIFVVRDDVRHKYVCLPGFRLFNGSVEGAKECAPEAVVVRPTLVVGSKGTVFVIRLWDQKSIIFLLVVSAPVTSSLG